MAPAVAGVTMVTGVGGPELSTVGAMAKAGVRVEAGLHDVVSGQLETMGTGGVGFVVTWPGATIRAALVTLQFVSGTAPLSARLTGAAADFWRVTLGLRPRLPRAVRVLFPNMGLVNRELAERFCGGVATGVFELLLLLVIMILVGCCCCDTLGN